MLTIGLGHKAQQGKDEVAAAIKRAFPRLDIRLRSFADPLRKELYTALTDPSDPFWETMRAGGFAADIENLPIPDDADASQADINAWFEANKKKLRKPMQLHGTEYRRHQDPSYWVNKAIDFIELANQQGAHAVVFRDLRFWNEYGMIGDMGGWRVKISRLGYKTGVPEHISETELDNAPFDLHLGVKDGQLGVLQHVAVHMFSTLIQASGLYLQASDLTDVNFYLHK